MNEEQGIVISSIDYKEKSKIVYLYTPSGHQSIRCPEGKSIKKGMLGFTTTLNVVSFIKSTGEFPSVIEYNLVTDYLCLTESIKKLEAVEVFINVVKQIPDDTDHRRCYDFVVKTLDDLKNTANTDKVLALFLIKMLYAFGINPELKKCVRCGNANIVGFSIESGGALCANHSKPDSNLAIWKEYYFEKKNIDSYTDTDFELLLNSVYSFYMYHTGINLRRKKL